jgi:hypothetical protein
VAVRVAVMVVVGWRSLVAVIMATAVAVSVVVSVSVRMAVMKADC